MKNVIHNATNIAEILKAHALWLNNHEEGTRANLRGANLRGADLRGADLRNADLRGADLTLIGKWVMRVTDERLRIGCVKKTFNEWDVFFDGDKTIETPRDTYDFECIYLSFLWIKSLRKVVNFGMPHTN